MTLEEFYVKYDVVKIVIDDTKHLLQFHIGNYTSKPVVVNRASTIFNDNFEVNGVVFNLRCMTWNGYMNVFVQGTSDEVNVPVEKGNIEYNKGASACNIRETLTEMALMREQVVRDIIAYFSQVDITYRHPCVIENPVDSMAGGITITGIRNGQAIEGTDEYEHCSYDVEQLDDETLIRLWDWIEWGTNYEPK